MLAPATINQMTLTERLQAMESLWDHLRQNEEEVPVPDWHKELLDERLKLVEQGKAHFGDWDAAKKRIAARTR